MIKPGFITVPNTTYDASAWEITSTVVLTSGVRWIGGKFTGTGAAFTSLGNCIGASIDSVFLNSSVSCLLDGNIKPFITYNGSDNTFLYKNLTVNGVNISGKTTLYNGTFEAPKTFHNVCFGLTINNVVKTYDANSENILVSGQSIYKFRGNDWKLIGNTKTGLIDNGVVQINSGNGQLKNIYRRGKQYGYIARIWGVKLGSDPDQDVRIENCVDAETVCYGTADVRIDPTQLQTNGSIPLSGVDFYFINNTSANKEDMNNGYVTNAYVIGQTVDDTGKIFSVYIKNSIAFGAHVSAMSGNSSLIKDNSSGKAIIVKQNNSDTPPGQSPPAGLVDENYYGLTSLGAQQATVPPPVKQRSAVSVIVSGTTAQFIYDDGTTTILNLKSSIIIQ